MPTSCRRCWSQFSLGTMLVVVTLFAVWLGWELSFIRQRKAAITTLSSKERGFSFATNGDPLPQPQLLRDDWRMPTIPCWRRWLGDEAVTTVSTPWYAPSLEEIEKLEGLFPESDFYRYDSFAPDHGVTDRARARRSFFSLSN